MKRLFIALTGIITFALLTGCKSPINTSLSNLKEITSFSIIDPSSTGVINNTEKTILFTLPHGTDVTSLVPNITHTGSSISPASGVARNFTSPQTYTVTAVDGSVQDYVATVIFAPNTSKAITAFTFPASTSTTLNEAYHEIAVTVPYGTDVSSLVPAITHTGSSISPASGVPGNFNTPQTYTVTAADGTSQAYTVTVNVALNTAKAIIAFTFSTSTSTIISEATNTISVIVPFGTNLTDLAPIIAHSGASISPVSGLARNFTTPHTYTVTAADGSTKNYTVNVSTFMITVPAGSYQRDSIATNISTIVTAFKMSEHEITRSQFEAIMGIDPSNPTYSSGINDPVQQVSWYHAIAFCNKLSIAEGLTPVYSVGTVDFSTLTYNSIPKSKSTSWDLTTADWNANGYRLPTEMEWMWAAMGATSDRSNGYTGDGVNTTGFTKGYSGSTEVLQAQVNIGNYAWYLDNSGNTTHPVGTTGYPNELGLYDMTGNVREWCWDWIGDYPAGPINSDTPEGRGSNPSFGRVMRGGGFNYATTVCTLANRGSMSPQAWEDFGAGFRVVRP